jgi:outer membrane protein OmpA-like peptidoglycan-associated protein
MRRRFLAAALPMLALAACQMPGQVPASRSVVFFTSDSAALDENAASLVAEVAERAKAAPATSVRVRGFAAPEGSAGFNRALSEARARNVADVLVAAGIDRSRIRIEPRGPVAYEMIPTESRRVEILLGS